MYRTLPVIIENNTLQGEARDLCFVSGFIFPIMTGVLYNIIQDQDNGCARETYKRTLTTFVNALYTIHSDCTIGLDLFRLEIESDQK